MTTISQTDGADERPTEARGNGIFDGFEGYRTSKISDFEKVLKSGLVVPDANVLLNLYRYTAEARDDLLSVLRNLGERLWIPHQVMAEFWRNRSNALSDHQAGTNAAIASLNEHRDDAVKTLRTWANRIALPGEDADGLTKVIKDAFLDVCTRIANLANDESSESFLDTNEDSTIQILSQVLHGRVGQQLPSAEYASAVAEAKRRIAAKEPPGYKDKAKDDAFAAGDYLVWVQTMREVKQRGRDVLFVTADVKEDWWHREHGQTRGPRVELVDEMLRETGHRLYMVRPNRLLELASGTLGVEVRETSVRDAERVERLNEVSVDGGWTMQNAALLIAYLREANPVQAKALRRAASQGGFVSRDDVYEIGNYEPTRRLNGFTRPIKRKMQYLQDIGLLPLDAIDVVETEYEQGWATGFRIPEIVLSAFEAAAALDWESIDYPDESDD